MDISSLIEFDKQLLLMINSSESLWLDNFACILTTATTWIPMYVALFYMVIKCNDMMKHIIFIIGCVALCVFISGSLNDMFVKPNVARWRPTHDPEIGILVDIVNGYRGGSYGFFSSHAANTFSIAIFFSLLVRNTALSVTLILWSFINCWTRMYLGVHFPGDILCGLIWGATVATTLYYIFLKFNREAAPRARFISQKYTSTGYLMTEIDVVISVFVFTILYAAIRSCC